MKLKSTLIALAAACSIYNANAATVAMCSVNDVTIEGASALSCSGMFSGNANDLSDVNNTLGTSYTDFSSVDIGDENTFSFSSTYDGIVEVILKQNTHWASYLFDLSDLDSGSDGFWNGTWNTSGTQWDGKPNVAGCQGCGGLSHADLVYSVSEVPLPGTLALLGLGLAGLGVVRRRV